MTWFEHLTGIVEHDSEQVRGSWSWVASGCARGPAAGRGVPGADLEPSGRGHLTLSERVAVVRVQHLDPGLADSMFQDASQFNLLEKISPGVSPEYAFGCYEQDRTQGAICAIS